MSDTVNQLERIRRLARDMGTPLSSVENLAISIPRAARLLDIQARTLRRALEADGVPLIRILGTDRIDVIDLVEFLERRKTAATPRGAEREQTWESLSSVERAALAGRE